MSEWTKDRIAMASGGELLVAIQGYEATIADLRARLAERDMPNKEGAIKALNIIDERHVSLAKRVEALEERLRVVWTAPINELEDLLGILAKRIQACERSIMQHDDWHANHPRVLAENPIVPNVRTSASDFDGGLMESSREYAQAIEVQIALLESIVASHGATSYRARE